VWGIREIGAEFWWGNLKERWRDDNKMDLK
jgi:hypothetical protein